MITAICGSLRDDHQRVTDRPPAASDYEGMPEQFRVNALGPQKSPKRLSTTSRAVGEAAGSNELHPARGSQRWWISSSSGPISTRRNVSGAEGGCEEGLRVGGEGLAVHRAVDDHGRGQPAEAEARDERCRLPVAVRDGGATSLAARTAPAQTGHLGRRSGFVQEQQLRRIKVGLQFEPGLSARLHVLAFLFGGCAVFF